MIETTESLTQHLELSRPTSGNPICAIDTEADSLHRYRESLCLIQFAIRGQSVLIDPLAIEDLSPLGDYLSSATVWMHGADYDMTMLKRQFGTLPAVIYDTQIGARLLGVRKFGLGDLVQHYFGVELSKSSQKADWGKRPLSPTMIEYALNDVNFLLEMGDIIVAKLKELGRHEWFIESCNSARSKVLDRDESKDEAWRIQGAGKLDGRGLACLKALWFWRDEEAKAWDKPSFMVTPNRQLIEWCHELTAGEAITLPNHFRADRIKRFRTAISSIEAQSEAEWPERITTKRRKRDRDFDTQVESLLKARDEAAARLDIDSSLIAARGILEAIAAKEITPSDALLKWQLEQLNLLN